MRREDDTPLSPHPSILQCSSCPDLHIQPKKSIAGGRAVPSNGWGYLAPTPALPLVSQGKGLFSETSGCLPLGAASLSFK